MTVLRYNLIQGDNGEAARYECTKCRAHISESEITIHARSVHWISETEVITPSASTDKEVDLVIYRNGRRLVIGKATIKDDVITAKITDQEAAAGIRSPLTKSVSLGFSAIIPRPLYENLLDDSFLRYHYTPYPVQDMHEHEELTKAYEDFIQKPFPVVDQVTWNTLWNSVVNGLHEEPEEQPASPEGTNEEGNNEEDQA